MQVSFTQFIVVMTVLLVSSPLSVVGFFFNSSVLFCGHVSVIHFPDVVAVVYVDVFMLMCFCCCPVC